MRDFHCRDAGMDCSFIAAGTTDDDVLKTASDHAVKVHHLAVSDELASKVRSLIHDQSSPAHSRSMSMR
jgi:predicted small metal-binding protein